MEQNQNKHLSKRVNGRLERVNEPISVVVISQAFDPQSKRHYNN